MLWREPQRGAQQTEFAADRAGPWRLFATATVMGPLAVWFGAAGVPVRHRLSSDPFRYKPTTSTEVGLAVVAPFVLLFVLGAVSAVRRIRDDGPAVVICGDQVTVNTVGFRGSFAFAEIADVQLQRISIYQHIAFHRVRVWGPTQRLRIELTRPARRLPWPPGKRYVIEIDDNEIEGDPAELKQALWSARLSRWL